MKLSIEFEDSAITAADVRAVLQNSPFDLGWFKITEEDTK